MADQTDQVQILIATASSARSSSVGYPTCLRQSGFNKRHRYMDVYYNFMVKEGSVLVKCRDPEEPLVAFVIVKQLPFWPQRN